MLENTNFSVYLQRVTQAALDKRGGNRSGIINRDLGRLYDLYDRALRYIALAKSEAMLICDVLEATQLDANTAVYIGHQIADAIKLKQADVKWGVDGPALIAKLTDLDHLTALAIVDAVEQYWVGAIPVEDPRALITKAFAITITAEELAAELLDCLNPKDKDLDNIGYVIDQLSDAERLYSREELENLPVPVWQHAWAIFDAQHGAAK